MPSYDPRGEQVLPAGQTAVAAAAAAGEMYWQCQSCIGLTAHYPKAGGLLDAAGEGSTWGHMGHVKPHD